MFKMAMLAGSLKLIVVTRGKKFLEPGMAPAGAPNGMPTQSELNWRATLRSTSKAGKGMTAKTKASSAPSVGSAEPKAKAHGVAAGGFRSDACKSLVKRGVPKQDAERLIREAEKKVTSQPGSTLINEVNKLYSVHRNKMSSYTKNEVKEYVMRELNCDAKEAGQLIFNALNTHSRSALFEYLRGTEQPFKKGDLHYINKAVLGQLVLQQQQNLMMISNAVSMPEPHSTALTNEMYGLYKEIMYYHIVANAWAVVTHEPGGWAHGNTICSLKMMYTEKGWKVTANFTAKRVKDHQEQDGVDLGTKLTKCNISVLQRIEEKWLSKSPIDKKTFIFELRNNTTENKSLAAGVFNYMEATFFASKKLIASADGKESSLACPPLLLNDGSNENETNINKLYEQQYKTEWSQEEEGIVCMIRHKQIQEGQAEFKRTVEKIPCTFGIAYDTSKKPRQYEHKVHEVTKRAIKQRFQFVENEYHSWLQNYTDDFKNFGKLEEYHCINKKEVYECALYMMNEYVVSNKVRDSLPVEDPAKPEITTWRYAVDLDPTHRPYNLDKMKFHTEELGTSIDLYKTEDMVMVTQEQSDANLGMKRELEGRVDRITSTVSQFSAIQMSQHSDIRRKLHLTRTLDTYVATVTACHNQQERRQVSRFEFSVESEEKEGPVVDLMNHLYKQGLKLVKSAKDIKTEMAKIPLGQMKLNVDIEPVSPYLLTESNNNPLIQVALAQGHRNPNRKGITFVAHNGRAQAYIKRIINQNFVDKKSGLLGIIDVKRELCPLGTTLQIAGKGGEEQMVEYVDLPSNYSHCIRDEKGKLYVYRNDIEPIVSESDMFGYITVSPSCKAYGVPEVTDDYAKVCVLGLACFDMRAPPRDEWKVVDAKREEATKAEDMTRAFAEVFKYMFFKFFMFFSVAVAKGVTELILFPPGGGWFGNFIAFMTHVIMNVLVLPCFAGMQMKIHLVAMNSGSGLATCNVYRPFVDTVNSYLSFKDLQFGSDFVEEII